MHTKATCRAAQWLKIRIDVESSEGMSLPQSRFAAVGGRDGLQITAPANPLKIICRPDRHALNSHLYTGATTGKHASMRSICREETAMKSTERVNEIRQGDCVKLLAAM